MLSRGNRGEAYAPIVQSQMYVIAIRGKLSTCQYSPSLRDRVFLYAYWRSQPAGSQSTNDGFLSAYEMSMIARL